MQTTPTQGKKRYDRIILIIRHHSPPDSESLESKDLLVLILDLGNIIIPSTEAVFDKVMFN